MQSGAVFQGDRLGLGEDQVQLPDGVQRMHIGRVAMIILMLHQARELVELRDEPAQHAELMHQIERRKYGARLRQDGPEADVGVGRMRDLAGDQGQRVADQGGQVKIRRAAQLLAMAEHADEPHRVILKNLGGLGGQLAAAQHETVNPLGALKTLGAERLAKRQPWPAGALVEGERQAVLDDL